MKNLLFALIFTSYASVSHAQVISYMAGDKDVSHFGDTLMSDDANRIESNDVVTVLSQQDVAEEQQFAQVAYSEQPEVIMYSASWCGYCKRAKTYFRRNGIAYKDYDVETSTKGKSDYRSMKGRFVPIFIIDGRRYDGFDAELFDRIFR